MDAARFVAASEAARASLDLAGVHDVVERWRGIAILQTDLTAYRRTMRRAAELATGTASPDDEPLEITTSKAGPWQMSVVETVGDDIDASIAALPPELLDAFAELRTALEFSPRTIGRPLGPTNPDGVRVATIGPIGTCQVVFHVLERDRVAGAPAATHRPPLPGAFVCCGPPRTTGDPG